MIQDKTIIKSWQGSIVGVGDVVVVNVEWSKYVS